MASAEAAGPTAPDRLLRESDWSHTKNGGRDRGDTPHQHANLLCPSSR
ncbi:MAG TPA: hypothetical protein VFW30_11845 [Bryocella sp.]|nr:hypothetical protein [Bryocella sp.]